ncbi:MAG: PxKF domain-containing protein [Gaiellaceae bacterium]
MTAQAVSAGSPDCEGIFQAGQEVQFSGGGFTPGADVRLYATSPGFGSSAELKLAEVSADVNGEIAGTVRIPLGATGFTQDDSGLVFLDAIGMGSAANHQDDIAMISLAPHSNSCGTVETLPFSGFDPPIANPPKLNSAQPGRSVPVKFSIPGSNGTLGDVLAPGYPQSASVSCSVPADLTTGDPTASVGGSSQTSGDDYNYVWKTDKSWSGCRELIVKLVDGSYHRALFNFGK